MASSVGEDWASARDRIGGLGVERGRGQRRGVGGLSFSGGEVVLGEEFKEAPDRRPPGTHWDVCAVEERVLQGWVGIVATGFLRNQHTLLSAEATHKDGPCCPRPLRQSKPHAHISMYASRGVRVPLGVRVCVCVCVCVRVWWMLS